MPWWIFLLKENQLEASESTKSKEKQTDRWKGLKRDSWQKGTPKDMELTSMKPLHRL